MKKILFAFLLTHGASAQNPVVPVLNTLIPDLEICGDRTQRIIDLSEHFGVEEIGDKAVRLTAEWRDLEGVAGTTNFDFLLFRNITPVTVANFLGYVNRGDYENMVVHRLVKDFVIQGGGFTILQEDTGPSSDTVTTQPAIVNEFGVSNTLGTISMAKLGGDPDSATSQWFISTGANSDNLDFQNGGFTVFGRISQETYPNAKKLNDGVEFSLFNLGGAFSAIPLIKDTVSANFTAERFFRFSSATEIPLPAGQAGTDTALTYSVISQSGDGFVTTTVDGGNLVIDFVDSPNFGTAVITVQVEDSVGNQVVDTFEITKEVSYEEWRNDNFEGSDLADDEVSGPMKDPNGDGVSNFTLFVLGLSTDGNQYGEVKSPRVDVRAADVRLELEVAPGLCEVDFIVEESSDLRQWSPSVGTVESSFMSGDREVARFIVPRSDPGSSPMFFRIRFAPILP